jgi:hypothetical protein
MAADIINFSGTIHQTLQWLLFGKVQYEEDGKFGYSSSLYIYLSSSESGIINVTNVFAKGVVGHYNSTERIIWNQSKSFRRKQRSICRQFRIPSSTAISFTACNCRLIVAKIQVRTKLLNPLQILDKISFTNIIQP